MMNLYISFSEVWNCLSQRAKDARRSFLPQTEFGRIMGVNLDEYILLASLGKAPPAQCGMGVITYDHDRRRKARAIRAELRDYMSFRLPSPFGKRGYIAGSF